MPEAVIVATGRTPIGRAFKGSLAECRPDDLTALVVRAVLEKVPALDPQSIEDLILGCGQPAGESGFNIARVAAVLAGLHDVPGVTVNRYCSSSLQTIRMAAHAIRAGEGDAFIAAGVETVSRFASGASDSGNATNPLFKDAYERTKAREAGGQGAWTAPAGLPDIYIAMGQTAENVAEYEKVSRQEMDEFAALSQARAVASQENGFFDREIIPVTTPSGAVVTKDDGPRAGTTVEKLATLQPVFRPGGSVTAGNASQLADGAAALVVTSEKFAGEHRLQVLARYVASANASLAPEWLFEAPAPTIARLLDRTGTSLADYDLFELNEAYAAQMVADTRLIGWDEARVNVNGGSIALGHALGSTGTRILATLVHAHPTQNEALGEAFLALAGKPLHAHA